MSRLIQTAPLANQAKLLSERICPMIIPDDSDARSTMGPPSKMSRRKLTECHPYDEANDKAKLALVKLRQILRVGQDERADVDDQLD